MNFKSDTAVKYHTDKFPPRLDYSLFLPQLLKATDALARFDQMLKTLHNNEILLAPLRNQEAVISSRIEGTISTMDEILQFEAENEDINSNIGNAKSDVIETLLYQRALKNAQKAMLEGYELSTGFIRQLHQQLLYLGRGAGKSPGQFKTEQNYLADQVKKTIQFIPVSPEKLTDGLEILFDYLNSSNDPVLIKTALMHLEFEALHPFQDGNGRIGRMLITLFLWKKGIISEPHFYISGYLEEHKDEYIDTMRNVSRDDNWEDWCNFFLLAVEKQAVKNLQITEQIKDLYEQMKANFSETLSSKYSVKALDFIFTNPVFRNSKFTRSSGIPSATATKFTKRLQDAKYLVVKQEASGRRPALYSFEPLMKLVRI